MRMPFYMLLSASKQGAAVRHWSRNPARWSSLLACCCDECTFAAEPIVLGLHSVNAGMERDQTASVASEGRWIHVP